MKTNTLYTSLTVEECKNIFFRKVKKSTDRMFKIEKTKYVGDFNDDEFWITRSIMSAFSDGFNRALFGTISENNGKRLIICNFNFPKSFLKSVIIGLSPMLLFFSIFPFSFVYGLLNTLYRIGYYGLVISVLCIIFYSMTLIQYRLALRYVKEMFQCDDGS